MFRAMSSPIIRSTTVFTASDNIPIMDGSAVQLFLRSLESFSNSAIATGEIHDHYGAFLYLQEVKPIITECQKL